MARVLPALCALALAFSARAQDGSAPAASTTGAAAGGNEDTRVIRQLIEQQSRQIEALTQQVSRLNQLLDARSGAATAAATPAVTQNMPPVQESAAASTSASAGSTPGSEPPKATPVGPSGAPAEGGGLTHVVAKGETLTSIAKHYKVSVADLLKVNKITDERKLQIGQTLIIPSTGKPAEPSPHP